MNDSSDREDVWEVLSVARGTILSADQYQIGRNYFDVGCFMFYLDYYHWKNFIQTSKPMGHRWIRGQH